MAAFAFFILAALFIVPSPAPAQVDRLGSEFQVNTFTPDFQIYPSVAAAPSGDFVVVWSSYDQDLSYGGIFGQRYDSSGNPRGGEFQVNTVSQYDQYFPDISTDSAGNFVVVWASYYQDLDELGVIGRRFAADGTPEGDEFQVNTYTYGYQGFPSVAAAPDGRFLVVWMSSDQDGDDFGIFGQRYDSNGNQAGPEFLVNSYTEDYQGEPSVSASDDQFVVVWSSFDQDGDGYGVFGQRFNSTGGILGPEFQANTYTTDTQRTPAVASDADGNFMVVWESSFQDVSDSSIFGQLFNANGTRQGGEFRVNEESTEARFTPSLAADPQGNFTAVWTADTLNGDQDIFGRRFNQSGSPTSAEFQVNSYTTGNQNYHSVAADAEGRFIVVWSSFDQDGSGYGIFGQRFSAASAPTECPGDCSSDALVTVNELVTGVNIALGLLPVGDCPAFDLDDSGTVTVNELIQAVNAALSGCPA